MPVYLSLLISYALSLSHPIRIYKIVEKKYPHTICIRKKLGYQHKSRAPLVLIHTPSQSLSTYSHRSRTIQLLVAQKLYSILVFLYLNYMHQLLES